MFKEEESNEIMGLLKKLRSEALHQEGYVSGETLVDPENPYNMMVISTWRDMEGWNVWKNSSVRKSYEAKLEEYQKSPTTYEVYVLASSFSGS